MPEGVHARRDVRPAAGGRQPKKHLLRLGQGQAPDQLVRPLGQVLVQPVQGRDHLLRGPGDGPVVRLVQEVRPQDLAGMSECFMLSSTRDVTPVAAVDDQRFKLGGDTVAARLKAAFADYARKYADVHSELKA